MLITISVRLCLALAPSSCVSEVVTNSDLDPSISMASCSLGMAALAKWKGEHPIYHADRWVVDGLICSTAKPAVKT